MGIKTAKEKLLTFATQFDPDIVGVGKTPPVVEAPEPEGDLLLSAVPTNKNNAAALTLEKGTLQNLKIEKKRVVPFVTSHVFNHDVSGLLDMLTARQLEKQLDDILLESLYEAAKIDENDAAFIVETLENIDSDLETMDTLLAALKSMQDAISDADSAFDKEVQVENITEEFNKSLQEAKLDETTYDADSSEGDFLATLADLTALSPEALSEMTLTGCFIQALADAEWSLRAGVSPTFFLQKGERNLAANAKPPRGFSRPGPAVKSGVGKTIKTLEGIGIGDDSTYDGIFNTTAVAKPPKYSSLDPFKRVAYLCSLLSREYLLSAGLGSQIGTEAGQAFGASSDPMAKIFGTSNISHVKNDQSVSDSLSDFAVVGEDASIKRKSSSKRVMMLEASWNENTNPDLWTTAKKEWLDSVKEDPLKNKADLFDQVITQATNRFVDAEAFLNSILAKDSELSLLTPTGLFSRVIKDFATLMQGLTVEAAEDVRLKNACELMLLSESAASGTYGFKLKRRMLIFAARLANLKKKGLSEEERDNFVRLTAREFSNKFESDITELKTDKDQVAFNLMSIWAGRTFKILENDVRIQGQQIIDAVVDNEESDGLNSLIVGIYEDLQKEAMVVAKANDESKSFMREGNTTRYSGFDGAITLSFIYECFALLASNFTTADIELQGMAKVHLMSYDPPPTTGAIRGEDKDKLKKATKEFMRQEQSVRFNGGTPDSLVNKTRRFLLEISTALDTGDFSNLLDSSGDVIAVEGLNESSDLGKNIFVSQVIDTCLDLSKDGDIPTKLFIIAKSMISNLRNTTKALCQRGAALKGNTQNIPDDIAVLKILGETKLGKDFIEGLTPSQLKYANKRSAILAESKDAPYILDSKPSALFKAIKMLFEKKKGEFSHSAVLFLGLPAGSLSEELSSSGRSEENARLSLKVDKVDELIGLPDYEEQDYKFSLKYSITSQSIVDAFDAEVAPTTFDALITLLNYDAVGEDEPILGSDILSSVNNKSAMLKMLSNEVESFLLKQTFEILEGFSLFEEKIQFNNLSSRGVPAKALTETLVKSMNLDENVPLFFFEPVKSSDLSNSKKDPVQGWRLPGEERISKMIQPQTLIVSGIDAWKKPISTPTQIDTIFDLFTTKPFYVDRVRETILTRSIFDKVYAIMIDLDSFNFDKDFNNTLLKQNDLGMGITLKDADAYIKNSLSPDRLKIESLYITAEIEGD